MASAATELYENASTCSPGRGHGGAEGDDEERGKIELDEAEAQDTEAQENPVYRMLKKTDSLSPSGSLRGSARDSTLGSPMTARDSTAASEDPTAAARHNDMLENRGSPGRSRSPVRGREPMYVTKWCSDHAGVGFQFNDSKNLVTYAGMLCAWPRSPCSPYLFFVLLYSIV